MPGAWMNPDFRAPSPTFGPTDPSNDEKNMTGEELDSNDRFYRGIMEDLDRGAQKTKPKDSDLDVLPKDVAPSPYGDSFNP